MSLNVNKLSISFQTDKSNVLAVDGVDFSLEPGKTLALLGESGCGKSLTALAIMRLLPQTSRYGRLSEIIYAEQDLLNLPERLMRSLRGRRLAIIFQEPMTALNPVLTIGQQLAEALTHHQGFPAHEMHTRLVALLQEVELTEPETRLKQYPHQLSGGQKQRVVIAMALACRPEVLIADEPTTALDVTIQAQILKLLRKLQAQYQMSLLLITHDLGVVKSCADHVCVMYAGQLIESAPAQAFFEQPLHPYVQRMFLSLPAFNKRNQGLSPIPGQVPPLDAMPTGCRFHPRCTAAFTPCSDREPELQDITNERSVRCHLYHESTTQLSQAVIPKEPLTPKELVIPAKAEIHSPSNSNLNSNNTDHPLLQVHDLRVYFNSKSRWSSSKKQAIKAVDGLSFNLMPGKTLALVGESGCGKTTVCRVLLGLQAISEGSVWYREHNVSQLRGRSLREFRKKVQMVFQDPYSSMNPRMTVGDILAEGMIAHGFSTDIIRRKQLEVLEQVSLPQNSLKRYPHQFSGGQRQRISIARALVTDPELLICDEPTSALDVSVQAQILNLLKTLQQEKGLSYLFITHNMAVVSYIADEVLVMRHGKAVEMGACDHIFHRPQALYTQELLAGVLLI